MKATKEEIMKVLDEMCEEEYDHLPMYPWESIAKDWKKYGKDRTYFSIYETRPGKCHFRKFDYGYLDNLSGRYVRGEKSLETALQKLHEEEQA